MSYTIEFIVPHISDLDIQNGITGHITAAERILWNAAADEAAAVTGVPNWDSVYATVSANSGTWEDAEPSFLKNTAFNKDFGVVANTVCRGDDPRLLSAVTTLDHGNEAHTSAFIVADDVTYENLNANGDVGTGATQVAKGNHSHSIYALIAHTIASHSDTSAAGWQLDELVSGAETELHYHTYIPLSGTTRLSGSVIPNTTGVDLGSASAPFRSIYLSGSSLHIGDTALNESELSFIKALSSDVVYNSDMINTITGDIASNDADITYISGEVASNDSDIATLSSDVDGLSGIWSYLDTAELVFSPTTGYTEQDATIRGHLSGIADAIYANDVDLANLQADLAASSGAWEESWAIQNLSAAIDGNTNDMSSLSGIVDGLSGQVINNDTNIDDLSAAIDGNTNDMASLSGIVETFYVNGINEQTDSYNLIASDRNKVTILGRGAIEAETFVLPTLSGNYGYTYRVKNLSEYTLTVQGAVYTSGFLFSGSTASNIEITGVVPEAGMAFKMTAGNTDGEVRRVSGASDSDTFVLDSALSEAPLSGESYIIYNAIEGEDVKQLGFGEQLNFMAAQTTAPEWILIK